MAQRRRIHTMFATERKATGRLRAALPHGALLLAGSPLATGGCAPSATTAATDRGGSSAAAEPASSGGTTTGAGDVSQANSPSLPNALGAPGPAFAPYDPYAGDAGTSPPPN